MKKWTVFVIMLLQLFFAACYAGENKPAFVLPAKNLDEYYMHLAIKLAMLNSAAPFAALIVDNSSGKILATGVNASQKNPLFHGEMVAINACIKNHPTLDWTKTTLYTTAEPCAMCQGAIVWMNISRVVFATPLEFLLKQGWQQIAIHAAEINQQSAFYKGSLAQSKLVAKTNALFAHK